MVLEDGERKQRLASLVAGLIDEEEHQEREPGGDDPGDRDRAVNGTPVVALAFDEPEDHAQQSERRERDTEEIEAVPHAGTQVGNQQQREREGQEPDGQVDEEDPPPPEVGDEQATERRSGHDRDSAGGSVRGKCDAALLHGEEGHHQRHALRREHGGADTLQSTRRDELIRVLREAAENGSGGEDRDARREQVARPVDVTEPCRCDQQHGVEKAVRVEHPQDLVERRVQAVEDRRDRDVDDRQIEQGHEHCQHQDGEGRHRVIANAGHLPFSFLRRTSRPIPSVLISNVRNGLFAARSWNWAGE